MNRPLPLAQADDPRLPPVVASSLRRCRMDPEWAPTISRLATGDIPASTLHCCGSGCRPCVADLVRCTRMTLEALEEGLGGGGAERAVPGSPLPTSQSWDAGAGDSRAATGVARRLARSVLRRFVGRGS